MRAALCCLGLVLTLTGCELFDQLFPDLIDNETEPAPEISVEPTTEHRGRQQISLAGGRLLYGKRALQLIDLSDPGRPRIERVLDRRVSEEGLFRLGDHVVFLAGASDSEYTGERDDVDLPNPGPGGLQNVDVTDPAEPRIVNAVAVGVASLGEDRRAIVKGQGQTGPAIFVAEAPSDPAFASQLGRYELQDGFLVRTGRLGLTTRIDTLSISGDRVLVTSPSYEAPVVVTVIDGTGPELRIVYETSVPIRSWDRPQLLAVDGNQLRVLYHASSSSQDTIDTFDLTQDAASGRTGSCELQAMEPYSSGFDGKLYARREHAFYGSGAGYNGLIRLSFDAAGGCDEIRPMGYDNHSNALLVPDDQRLLALGGSSLRLYDTTLENPDTLLADEQLDFPYDYSEGPHPIQVFPRAGGTTEPWLIGVTSHNTDEIPIASFELLTASRQTVTKRAAISEHAFGGEVVLYDDTLVTLSSIQLRTFDIRELDAPRELARLDINASYYDALHFGSNVARFRQGPRQGPPDGGESANELQIVRLDATGEPAIAAWPIGETAWLPAHDLLLEFSRGSEVQVYDLSDAARPRKAASFSTAELTASSYLTVGRALVILQHNDPTPTLAVIDFQDPDNPALVQSRVELPISDVIRFRTGLRDGTRHFFVAEKADGLYAISVDFTDPHAPQASAPRPIPGALRAADANAVYSVAYEQNASTLSRTSWTDPPAASQARTWPDRVVWSTYADAAQHVYLIHGPRQAAPGDWVRLEVLDAESLDTLSTFDIDVSGRIAALVKGRLLIELPGALLFVDVRDPLHIAAQAAVPFRNALVMPDNGKVYVVSNGQARGYPIDLQNLQP